MEERKKDVLILAIETSCDETACAILENGRALLSSVVASQMEIHARYGGVFPEVASISVSPGLMSPRFSACIIILYAGRSFTEPAGLFPSSLANTVA